MRVWYLCATVELAEELAKHYGEGAAVLRGRTHGLDTGSAPPCARAQIVAEAMAAGIRDINGAFCFGKTEKGENVECPYFQGCTYFDQFADARAAEIVFLSHSYLFTAISAERLPKPELVIIDESPINSFIALAGRFTPDAALELADAHHDAVKIAVDALVAKNDPRTALKAAGYSADDLGAAAIALTVRPEIDPSMDDKTVRSRLATARSSKAAIMLRRLAAEFDSGRPLRGVYAERVKRKTEDGPEMADVIFCQHRKRPDLPERRALDRLGWYCRARIVAGHLARHDRHGDRGRAQHAAGPCHGQKHVEDGVGQRW